MFFRTMVIITINKGNGIDIKVTTHWTRLCAVIRWAGQGDVKTNPLYSKTCVSFFYIPTALRSIKVDLIIWQKTELIYIPNKFYGTVLTSSAFLKGLPSHTAFSDNWKNILKIVYVEHNIKEHCGHNSLHKSVINTKYKHRYTNNIFVSPLVSPAADQAADQRKN